MSVSGSAGDPDGEGEQNQANAEHGVRSKVQPFVVSSALLPRSPAPDLGLAESGHSVVFNEWKNEAWTFIPTRWMTKAKIRTLGQRDQGVTREGNPGVAQAGTHGCLFAPSMPYLRGKSGGVKTDCIEGDGAGQKWWWHPPPYIKVAFLFVHLLFHL